MTPLVNKHISGILDCYNPSQYVTPEWFGINYYKKAKV